VGSNPKNQPADKKLLLRPSRASRLHKRPLLIKKEGGSKAKNSRRVGEKHHLPRNPITKKGDKVGEGDFRQSFLVRLHSRVFHTRPNCISIT
jgi:hypothetical protein